MPPSPACAYANSYMLIISTLLGIVPICNFKNMVSLPIAPASDKGHRYILTLVDYATRYPEAVTLNYIDTETVTEALLDM